MELPSRQPQKLRPRIDFRPEDFRKLMFQRGMRVKWEQANECPCVRRTFDLVQGEIDSQLGHDLLLTSHTTHTTAEPDLDCPMCLGKGYILHSGQNIRALVTRGSESPQPYRPYGEVATGGAFFTLLPEHLPAMYDRFTLLDSVIVFRETLIRKSGVLQSTRYPIVTRNLDLATGLTAVSVLHLQAATLTGATTDSQTLTQGQDFTVTDDGKIDFTLGDANGKAPVENARYSVAYYGNPRYVITDHPHAFRDSFTAVKAPEPAFTPMPVQASGKLDFMGDRNG